MAEDANVKKQEGRFSALLLLMSYSFESASLLSGDYQGGSAAQSSCSISDNRDVGRIAGILNGVGREVKLPDVHCVCGGAACPGIGILDLKVAVLSVHVGEVGDIGAAYGANNQCGLPAGMLM